MPKDFKLVLFLLTNMMLLEILRVKRVFCLPDVHMIHR